MKAFHFRLDQALRWRNSQSIVQEAKVSSAAAAVSRIQLQVDRVTAALHASAGQVRQTPTGEMLNAHAAFARHAEKQMTELRKHLEIAQRKLAAEMASLTEARRRLRLIEELKQNSRDRWQKELDKETGDFADESYVTKLFALKRLQSKKQHHTQHGGA